MKLVIHAGIHRTGTSSLQDFLASNRDALRQRGILYPGETKNHQQLAWSIKRGDAGPAEVRELMEEGRGDCGTVVLSAEDFCIHKDLSWLEELATDIPTSVHFYLRRQDHWLMSWYNQHIKWPFDKWKSRMTPEEFLECVQDFYWIDFSDLVRHWVGVLGTDAVHVAVMEAGQVEDVTVDFIGHLDIAQGELPSPSKRANNSMPVHLLEIARHFDMHAMSPAQRIRFIGALRKALPAPADLPKTVYSPAQRSRILDRFAESNRRLARDRFQRQDLFLEPPPHETESFYRFPEITTEEYLAKWIKPVVHEVLKR